MKSMGFTDLRLAACPEHDAERALSLAVHAEDVYIGARRTSSLSEALEDTSISAGFTRRLGERRKGGSLSILGFASLAAGIDAGRLALVFGNERTGLTDEELALCSLAVSIPSSDACPSLNVAQAVQIACWETAKALGAGFFRAEAGLGEKGGIPSLAGGRKAKGGSGEPAERAFLDAEIADLIAFLGSLGFFRRSDSSHVREFLRDLCERASASREESKYLSTLFRRAGSLSALRDRKVRRGRL